MNPQGLGFAAPILLIGVLQWLTPSLVQRTVPFGVRIPAERAGEPLIARLRGRYRVGIVLVTLAALAATLLVGSGTAAQSAGLVVELAGSLAVYLAIRSQLLAAKSDGRWFAGLKQVTVVDTTLRTAPERYPWQWELPSLLLAAGTLLVGIIAYPSRPARLVTRFDLGGHPTGHADKTIASAFAPVGQQIVVTAILLALTRTILHGRAQLDAEDPHAAHRHRRFVRALTRAMLVLTLGVSLGFLFSALMRWNLVNPPAPTRTALVALPSLLAALFLIGAALRTGQGGSREPIPETESAAQPHSTAVNRDDDRFYKLGIVYYNPDDPALWVPKRFGVGWTVNFARPAAWLILVIPALAIAAGLVLH